GTGTCVVTMSQARNVTADFGVAAQSLTITKAGSGAGTVTSDVAGINCGTTCSASFPDGTVVTLTAVASPGSAFAGRSAAGCFGTGTCTVTMSVARNVTATFILTQPLAVTKTGSGTGTVGSDVGALNCGSTCSVNYVSGTVVTLSAAASPGSRFGGWSGSGCSGTGTCTVTMSQARTVTATFIALHTLTVSKKGSGRGTVSSNPGAIDCGSTCAAGYDQDAQVTLSATAAAGSRFAGWSGAGCSGIGTCTVALSEARGVTAIFVQVVPLDVTVAGAGSVSSNPSGILCGHACTRQYDAGTDVTLTAAAKKGRWFQGWSGACTGTKRTCIVTMSEARLVHARFVRTLALRLRMPGKSVYHSPHERAKIGAFATLGGKPLARAHVKLTITCPGRHFTAALTTKRNGRTSLVFSTRMPNWLRVYTCKVRGRVTANHRKARAKKAGIVHFIHPLWLESKVVRGKVVVRVYGRPGESFELFANGNVVGRARLGRRGWAKIVFAGIRHGDGLWVTGRDGHRSHRISPPKRA
ncbi:MAG: hypothetical protein ABI896_08475, partial [Actinomycetota bacterium]